MGSLFTNGGKIKDVIGHDSYNEISHKFHFSFCIYHFEHIY
jgi:hydrogenase maturation factor